MIGEVYSERLYIKFKSAALEENATMVGRNFENFHYIIRRPVWICASDVDYHERESHCGAFWRWAEAFIWSPWRGNGLFEISVASASEKKEQNQTAIMPKKRFSIAMVALYSTHLRLL